MKQKSLSCAGFDVATNRTRKRVFLDEMEQIVPCAALTEMFEPHFPTGKNGCPTPFPLGTMLRVHFMQQCFNLSDPAMEEALHDFSLYREFARLDAGMSRLPDETTILRFRHLLEEHALAPPILNAVNAVLEKVGLMVKTGTIVDATLIAATSLTKNSRGERDPEMHQTKKCNQWYFGMKDQIGTDAESGLVHAVIGTSANVNDVTQGHALPHGKEEVIIADAGYQGADKRPEATGVAWQIAMRPGKRRALPDTAWGRMLDEAERLKAGLRAKVEHSFRVVKRQFGYVKVRYRGLKKNTAQLTTLFALSNLWMARGRLLQGSKG